jgi:hypothetical protein
MITTKITTKRGSRLTTVILLLLLHPLLAIQAKNNQPALLPMPQKIEWHDRQQSLARVMVEASIHRDEIEDLLKENGSTIAKQAALKLTVSMVASITQAAVNQGEAYRLKS